MESEEATFKTLPCVRSKRFRVYLQKRPCHIGYTWEPFESAHGSVLQCKTRRNAEHTTHTTQHTTTQQVHLDNLFLHEASCSPTNEGPRPTHSGPQSKCFLHRELSGRVIIVIVIGREMKRERERQREIVRRKRRETCEKRETCMTRDV